MSRVSADQINTLLGARVARDDAAATAGFAVGGVVPPVVAHPESAEQVAALLGEATTQGWGVIPHGAGTAMGCGRPPAPYDLALSMAKLGDVLDHDVENLTLTVGAGATLLGLNRHLEPHNQMLALGAPTSLRTVGGVISSNPLMPKRLLYGDVRDQLLGVRVALPNGHLVRYGRKVIKNVAGYDMNKLFLGARGMFGVVVEATFKLFARPDEEAWLLGAFVGLDKALEAGASLVGSRLIPAAVLLLDGPTLQASGLAGNATRSEAGYLLARFEGRHAAITRQLRDALAIMQAHGGAETARGGAMPTGATEAVDLSGLAVETGGMQVRVALPATSLHEWMEATARLGRDVRQLADCGSGLTRAIFPPGEVKPEDEALWREWLDDSVRGYYPQGGYRVLESAPAAYQATCAPWAGMESEDALTRRFRAHFDPSGIMVPGRYL